MSKMTIQELESRLSWTLDQKIDHCIGTIENFVAKTGHEVYVSFSGGKDSTILLDIARRYYKKDILGVFCNTGNEYPEIVRFVHSFDNVKTLRIKTNMVRIIKEKGFPLVSKDVSEKVRQLKHSKSDVLKDIRLHGYAGQRNRKGKLSTKWQYLKDAPFDISERCCDIMKKSTFKKFERQTGLYPLIGIRTAESRQRTFEYLKRGGCTAFNGKRPRSFPISLFTDSDVEEYIRRFKVKLCPIYNDPAVHRTGCMCCGFGADQDKAHFDYLYQHYPKVYAYFMNLQNNGVTYREALHYCHVSLPDD